MEYKYYDYIVVLNTVKTQCFDGMMLIFDLSTEKYIFIDESKNKNNNRNIHGIKQNDSILKTQYLSTKIAANHLLQQLVEKKYPNINYDKQLKKLLEANIPAGFVSYNASIKERVYDVNGVKYFNSCYLPEHYYKEHKHEIEMEDFYKGLDKYPEFNFLLNSLFDEKEDDIKYFLNWLGSCFMGRKNLTSVIITGTPGSGKGVLMNYISWYFGETNILSASNELLTSTFNEQMENRMFINLNEITLNKNRELYEKLKTWITDPTYNLNIKSIRQRTLPNNINFLITTNNQIPIEVSVDDRRYSIFKTKSENLKTNVSLDFFKKFEKSFKKFTEEFKKVKIDFAKADLPIDNELKQNIAQASTTKSELLLKSILRTDIDTLEKYKEVFLEYIPESQKTLTSIQKGINITNYNQLILDIQNGYIKNVIAQWSYMAFVDKKIQIATIGQKFNSYIGSPTKKTIDKKRVLVRLIPESIKQKDIEESTKKELLDKIKDFSIHELREVLNEKTNNIINIDEINKLDKKKIVKK